MKNITLNQPQIQFSENYFFYSANSLGYNTDELRKIKRIIIEKCIVLQSTENPRMYFLLEIHPTKSQKYY